MNRDELYTKAPDVASEKKNSGIGKLGRVTTAQGIGAGGNWKNGLPAGKLDSTLFDKFELRAKNVSAEVFRVKTAVEASEVIANLARFTNAEKVVMVDGPLQLAAGISDTLKSLGIAVHCGAVDICTHVETADIGISSVEFGIAETGSVCQNAYAIEDRLVSSLPPVHVAFMNSSNIVPGIDDALDIISRSFNHGYISFITGPSRTADIERVLTIGVHGPSRFVIVAVDEKVV